jgi:protocatechuate 3,4-dioxygenase beta subunit
MAVALLQFLAGTIAVSRAIRRGRRVEAREWLALLCEASARLGVRGNVELRETNAVAVPVVWGWRRPVILIPTSSASWPREQRRAFLLHELAHVARRDCLAQAMAAVAHAIYWPHPLVWWAVRRLRAEAERACDDLVLVAGTAAPEYAQYLLDAARVLRGARWLPASSSAVVERTHLGDRLLALLDDGKNRGAVRGRVAAMACAVVFAVVAALAAAQPAVRAAAVKAMRAVVAPLVEEVVPKPSVKASPLPSVAVKGDSALAGTVKGPDGKPVEGALVVARPAREWSPLVTGTTAADGRFRLALPLKVSGSWDMTIEAKGLAAVTLERITVGTPVSVILEKGGVITGIVRDGTDGRPLSGARVSAAVPNGLRYALPWQPSSGLVEAQSDRNGRFRLEGVAPGLFEVSARAPRYGAALRRNVRAGASVDLVLFPGASISGTVRGVGDRPVAGAIVAALRRTNYGWTPAAAETTDSRGGFVVAGAQAGSYLLMARHPDLAPALVQVDVEALAEAHVDIPLRPGSPVLGHLVDEHDRPVVGKVVFEEIGGIAVPRQLAESLKVETGSDGVFVLERVAAGAHDLGLTASGFAPRRLEIEVGSRAKAVDLGTVVLERGLTIAGRVVNRAGGPIANAKVFAWPVTSATFAFNSSSPDPVVSEADGSFVIGGLAPGAHNITASIPGYVTGRQAAEAGAEKPVRLVLSPAGAITGSVVDSRRRPVETFTVMAERVEKDGDGYGASGFKEVAAPDWRFTIDDLAEGTYVVRARAPETAPGSVSGVQVVAAKATDAGVIRLGAGGVVHGSVVDTTGAPVVGATVSAVIPGPRQGRDRAEGQSDGGGSYELGGVPPGRVTVTATHPSYAAGQVAGLDVDPANGPAEANIVLSVGGRIQGSVRKRDGTPIPGVLLSAGPRRSDVDNPVVGGVEATVQNDGTFSMEHLPPGATQVTLTAQPSPGVSLVSETKNVVVVDGQTTVVDFTSREVLVTGRVTRGEAAMPGVRVTMRTMPYLMSVSGGAFGAIAAPPPAGPRPLEGITRDDGHYELIVLHPGSAWAEVASLDGRVQYASRTFEVPDVESHVLDIPLGGAPVSGIVVDKDTGAAVPRANVRAAAKKGEENGGAKAGADGRFAFELVAGDYQVTTSADGYAPVDSDLTVAGEGASDVRLELGRGLVLEGRVVDPVGHPVPGAQVFPTVGDSPTWLGMAVAMDDGRFRLEHLLPRAYTLATGSPANGFAIRKGVSPGDKDIVLTLSPGGRVRLSVFDPGGAPVAEASGSLVSVDGSKVSLFLNTGRTDSRGVAEFVCPAGAIEISVQKGKLVGRTTVQVEAGATATARVVLGPPPGP